MDIKREAAYHEAAHAVLAYHSKYHALVGGINLLDYGAGEVYASPCKSKCAAKGKPYDANARKDKDMARDIAIVLCAGLAGERLAAEHDSNLIPNPTCAEPDHELTEQVLQLAGLSKKYDHYEAQARDLLKLHWPTVDHLAKYLFEKISATPDQVLAIIVAR